VNGRMFEAFLAATMRGQALGQFFTPRSIVKLMTQLAAPVPTPWAGREGSRRLLRHGRLPHRGSHRDASSGVGRFNKNGAVGWGKWDSTAIGRLNSDPQRRNGHGALQAVRPEGLPIGRRK